MFITATCKKEKCILKISENTKPFYLLFMGGHCFVDISGVWRFVSVMFLK
ncbi:hypothetical protein FHW17_000205 [Phyllobacterium sp. P30BS-XVII]|nr:hypothetical protein [Phyllobacterium sp. P30BS-XVII]